MSPLFIGAEPLDQDRLSALAKRLRDLLVGDVVRGVEVGLDGDDNVMARAGSLEAVDLGWSSLGSILGLRPDMTDGNNDNTPGGDPSWDNEATLGRLKRVSSREALHMTIRYESALCTALLLPQLEPKDTADPGDEGGVDMFQQVPPHRIHSAGDSGRNVNPDHFHNLPLLLFRMPTPLRTVLIDFLSRTFDCRISPLRLGTRTLLTNLERWAAVSKLMRGSAASKDVVITLGFTLPTPLTPEPETDDARTSDLGLKSMDVIISASDLQGFRDEGTKYKASGAALLPKRKSAWDDRAAKRRKVGGSMIEEGWDWKYENAASFPFTEALGRYFDEHLALNLFDSRTKITKVACGGFVMSESRLKLFSTDVGGGRDHPTSIPNVQAVVDCLNDLQDRATARDVTQ